MGDLCDAAHERLSVRTLAGAAAVVATWTVLFDARPPQVAASLGTAALVGGADLLADAYDVEGGRLLGLGVAGAVSAALLGAFGDSTPWLPLGLGAVAAWMVADAVQTIRHGPPGRDTAAAADGTEVYHRYVAGQIQERLDDGPKTRLDLKAALDADEAAVGAALDLLETRDAVERAGGTYRRTAGDDGRLDRLRERVAWAAGRIIRPVTVERAGGDDHPRAPGRDGTGQALERARGRGREQERERR